MTPEEAIAAMLPMLSMTSGGSDTPQDGNAAAARALKLVQRLRFDTALADAIVVAEGKEFPIHRTVVVPLSEFFSNALVGDFSEAKNRKIILADASADTVAVMLDFAYGIDISSRLADFEFALDLSKLAHRYQIDRLREKATSHVMERPKAEHCVQILHHVRIYGLPSEVTKALRLISARVYEISRACGEFYTLSLQDLKTVLSSRDLVATEVEKFEVVTTWATRNEDLENASHSFATLFSHVKFQRLDRDKASQLLTNTTLVPKSVFVHALSEMLKSIGTTSGFYEVKQSGGNGAAPMVKVSNDTKKVEFMLAMSTTGQDGRFYFSFHRWAMWASLHCTDTSLQLVLSFDHGMKKDADTFAYNLTHDISGYRFLVNVKKWIAGQDGGNTPVPFESISTRWEDSSLVCDLNRERGGTSFLSTLRTTNASHFRILVQLECSQKMRQEEKRRRLLYRDPRYLRYLEADEWD